MRTFDLLEVDLLAWSCRLLCLLLLLQYLLHPGDLRFELPLLSHFVAAVLTLFPPNRIFGPESFVLGDGIEISLFDADVSSKASNVEYQVKIPRITVETGR